MQIRMSRHTWNLKAAAQNVTQYQCKRCGTVKTSKSNPNGFPTVTYVTMDQQSTRTAPPCKEKP
jgi:hypothetical protein